MPRVKIALLSNYPDLTEWYPKQVSLDLKSPITPAWTVRENCKISTVEAAAIADKLGQITTAEYEKMWVTTEKGISEALELGVSPFSPPFKFQANWIVTVGEKSEAIELEFVPVVNGQELDKLHDAYIVLFLIPAPAEPDPLQIVADKISADPFVNAIPNTALALLVFLGDGQTLAEKTIQSKLASVFPNTMILAGKNIGQEIFRLAQSAAATKKSPSADANDLTSVPLSSGNKDQPPRFISRLLGAVLRAVFGAIVSVVVYNPISSLFAALSALHRDMTKPVLHDKISENLITLVISPTWGPLKGIFYNGIYCQMRRGWSEGILSSLRPFYEVPLEADLMHFRSDTFSEDMVESANEAYAPISSRNIIAGIIITSLVIAAGLAVWLPAVNAVLGISAYAAMYGLGSLSLAQLSLAASGAALIAGSFLYGLGVGVVKLSKIITNAISEQLQKDDKPAGAVSKFFGAIVGAVYGALAGMIISNPVTSLFFGMRALRQVIKNDKNKSFLTVLGLSLLFLTSFIWLPLVETLIVGLLGQGSNGSYFGLAAILGFGKLPSAAATVYSPFRDEPWAKSDIIAGLVITALMVAAGLAFVITPVSIFLGIPALLTIYGLVGLSPWSLALIAAGVTFAVTSVLYSIGSNGYDLYRDWQDKPASSVSATRTDTSQNSAAKVVQLTGGAQAVHCESQKDSSPGVLEKNLPGPIANGGSRQPTGNTSIERAPLVAETDEFSSERCNRAV